MVGRYIVIEGPQGVGKTTMVQRLAEKIQESGLPVRIMREPDSQNDLTARAIRHLTQDPRYPMNTRTEVLLYNAARSQSLEVIRTARDNGVICLVDRSYLTTLAIQYYGRGEVQDYQRINDIIEFAVGDMHPDLMLVLDAPVDVLKERTSGRYQGDRFDNLDKEFLDRVRAGYLWEAQQRELPVIYADDEPDAVFNRIWKRVSKTIEVPDLEEDTPKKSEESRPVTSVAEVIATKQLTRETREGIDEPMSFDEAEPTEVSIDLSKNETPANEAVDSATWLEKNEAGVTIITGAGKKRLSPLVTSTEKDVYAFTSDISPLTTAAAMARLSRRGDDMRITLLDEFIDKEDKDGSLLKRVITAYGDDSVQQLVGQHIVVENASNLLTKKLEWGRLAAYLEQSTRYIYFDQKDKDGKYRYYVPESFSKDIRQTYIDAMDAIFRVYGELVSQLTDYVRRNSSVPKKERDAAWKSATKAQACDAIRPLLPVATKSTVGIFASAQALESLIMHLTADDLPEARKAGQQILEAGRAVIPAMLERADKPEKGGAWVAYKSSTFSDMQELTDSILSTAYTPETSDPVSLTSVTPRNELDVAADMLYEHSDRPLDSIRKQLQAVPFDSKRNILTTYFGERLNRRHRPGRALETIHYSFDLICDYGIFRDLQRHRMVDDLEWQRLSPRLGYEVPKLVDDAGLSDLYDKCFDISLALYSKLSSSGYELEAQYATLLGHKMRWKVTMNAREAFHFIELRTAPQGHPGYRKLAYQMFEKIREVHPIIAEGMKFVNKDEDPELTRLAAERYAQFKLSNLR